MIDHKITGSLQQWELYDEKSKTNRWRGYIAARIVYPDETRAKFPFLTYQSCRQVDDQWFRCIYLNDAGQWQAKFCMIGTEEKSKELMASLVKPEFKTFVELLAPEVPEDFKMPKSKRAGANKEKGLTSAQPELFSEHEDQSLSD